MIIKGYAKSIHIDAMESLLKRLPTKHPLYSKILMEIRTTRAGDFGEEIVFKELEQIQLPFTCFVFHKLLLRSEKPFELDFLLITPFGAVILEVKNIVGTLEFKENPSQIVQKRETGEVNKYVCPATQLNEYKYQLSQFFIQENIPIPIYGAVVFASRNSFVKVSTNKATLLYRNEIRTFLRNLENHPPAVTDEEIVKVKDILLNKNTPFMFFPLTKYFSINSNDLIRGVECCKCGFIGMQKIKRTWFCPSCQKKDHHAYKSTLISYFLLSKDSITNKECREFLLLNNRHEATRILTSQKLLKIGNKKSTSYQIKPFNDTT